MKPKKERPSALGCISSADSIFQARLKQAPDGPEEIPVHNTFIQFAMPPSTAEAGDAKKPLCTAPAWLGPSFQSILHEASIEPQSQQADVFAPLEGQDGKAEPFFKAEEEETPQDIDGLGSPQKLPMMRYALSSSSARAAGHPEWSPSAVADVGTPAPMLDTAQDENAASAAVGSRAGALGAVGSPVAAAAVPTGAMPSQGSSQHFEGACKRCCFFPKGRCQNGFNCEFCHFDHEKRKRKKKKKGAGARKDAAGSESESDEDDDDGAQPKQKGQNMNSQSQGGAWALPPDPIGTTAARAGLPLTAPPLLPPRGLPLPSEPPPPRPHMPGLGQVPLPEYGADSYYGYDLPPGVAGTPYSPAGLGGYGASPYGGGADGRLAGLGGIGINQSYFGGGYDPAAVAAQQQQTAYQQQAQGRYLPPPR